MVDDSAVEMRDNDLEGDETTAVPKSQVLENGDQQPQLLSDYLKTEKSVSPEDRQAFIKKSQDIFVKESRSDLEKEWLADYIQHQADLFHPSTTQNSEEHHISREEYVNSCLKDLAIRGYSVRGTPGRISADLSKLFVRPEVFDGDEPEPRDWLDQYEKAAFFNDWSDAAKVKFMPTFLMGMAYTWLTEVVPLHRPLKTITWPELRAFFVDCYMGDLDRYKARRDLERAHQKEGEKVAHFIPRMVYLIRMVSPELTQKELVGEIRQRLLPGYQERLAQFELTSIEKLYDYCDRVDEGSALLQASQEREAKEREAKEAQEREAELRRQFQAPRLG